MATWQFGYSPVSTIPGYSASGETVGTGNGSTTTFSYTVTYYPILPTLAGGTVQIAVNGTFLVQDVNGGSGTGTFTWSSSGGGTGTVNYSTGAISLTFGTAPAVSAAITVTYNASTINTAPANNDWCVFNIKQVMKAAGWTVQSSSDGTTYNSSGDQITKGTSSTNGISNTSAWFRIRAPTGTREYIFKRGSTAGSWYFAASKVGFSGGSPNATTTPTASDQFGCLGEAASGTTVAFTDWFSGNTATTFHHNCAADSSAPYGVYAFAFPKNSSTSTSGFHFFGIDSLQSGSYQSADTDPYVTQWSSSPLMLPHRLSG